MYWGNIPKGNQKSKSASIEHCVINMENDIKTKTDNQNEDCLKNVCVFFFISVVIMETTRF